MQKISEDILFKLIVCLMCCLSMWAALELLYFLIIKQMPIYAFSLLSI